MGRAYVPASYGSNSVPNVEYIDYATAKALIVEGKTYDIQVDTVPLLRGATNSEVTFVPNAPVSVLR